MAKTRYSSKNGHIRRQLLEAIHACREKKGEDISLLKLGVHSGAFTDYFVVCTGTNPRQIQAISDEIETRLERTGARPTHTEGYNQAEWVLLDYVDFVVHVFSPKARGFYDLERLWKSATRLNPDDLKAAAKSTSGRTTPPPAGKRRAVRSATAGSRPPKRRKS